MKVEQIVCELVKSFAFETNEELKKIPEKERVELIFVETKLFYFEV